MAVSRVEYVLDDTGWDEETRLSANRRALALVRPAVTSAETDIPWHQRDRWPPEVVAAAERLGRRYARKQTWDEGYLQTGVVRRLDDSRLDDSTLDDVITVAPYAYDAGFWGDDGELAHLSDEGSMVVHLTEDDRSELARTLGADRIVSLDEWGARHPSAFDRLVQRLSAAVRGSDRFFPVANGEAIAREIPGARLLVLDQAASAIPRAATRQVAEAMLALGRPSWSPSSFPR